MSFPPSRQQQRLSAATAEAIETACGHQLELVQDHLRSDPHLPLAECHEALGDWQADECLVMDLDLDDRLELLEQYAADYGLELGAVTLEELRNRIETMAALVVGYLGEDRAREAFRLVEELLEEKELPFEALLVDDPYAEFRPFALRDESPWQVSEYRNLPDAAGHVDLYELEVVGICFYVRLELERGLGAEEEGWEVL